MKKRILFAAGVVMLCAFCAQAQLIYIAIEADVYYVSDSHNHLKGKITTSSTITGYYCYESTIADSEPSDEVGEWWNNTPCGVFLNVGGFNFESDSNNTEFYLAVANDQLDGDAYIFRSKYHKSLSNGVTINDIVWQLNDPTGTALSSDALPTTAPVPNDWDNNRLYIKGGPRGAEFGIDATVTFAEPVPEPVTILLLSLGTLALRKRRQ